MGFDLQARRCGCGAIFRLATLRARETECANCMRVRSSNMQAAALASGLHEPVLKQLPGRGRLVVDCRQKTPVPPNWWGTGARPAAEPVPGQLFETRNEAEFACPVGWSVIAELSGGWRVQPPDYRERARKALARRAPAEIATSVGPRPRSMSERIEAAREILEARARDRAEAQRGQAMGLGAIGHAIGQAVAGGMLGQGQALGQLGNKVFEVRADPNVPRGQVVMQWIDAGGGNWFTRMRIDAQQGLADMARQQWGIK